MITRPQATKKVRKTTESLSTGNFMSYILNKFKMKRKTYAFKVLSI